MRKITRQIVAAFNDRRALKISNTRTDGQSIWLFNNRIVTRDSSGDVWISAAGWKTRTTLERLQGVADVRSIRGNWFIGDRLWRTDVHRWINISNFNSVSEVDEIELSEPDYIEEDEFDYTSEWLGDKGYSKPIYSVCHTKNIDDLIILEDILNSKNIKSNRTYSDTEGTWSPNHFLIVKPIDYNKAIELLTTKSE